MENIPASVVVSGIRTIVPNVQEIPWRKSVKMMAHIIVVECGQPCEDLVGTLVRKRRKRSR